MWTREAALHRGSAELRPADLAVGMLASPSGVAARAMAQVAVSHASARAALEEIARAEVLDHASKTTLSPWCKQALVFALDEQAASDADAMGTGHILLGSTAVPDWLMDKLLEKLGVDRDAIRAAVFTVLSSDPHAVEREGISPVGGSPLRQWMRRRLRRLVRESVATSSGRGPLDLSDFI